MHPDPRAFDDTRPSWASSHRAGAVATVAAAGEQADEEVDGK